MSIGIDKHLPKIARYKQKSTIKLPFDGAFNAPNPKKRRLRNLLNE
jgi:hypothetical protein